MANALFNGGREGFLDGSIDWDTNDIRVMLVLSAYMYDVTDRVIADLGAVDNGRSVALGVKTVTDGVADAADTTITVTAAAASNALIVFQHTGADLTARLIAYFDTATGLPFTPALAQVVTVQWDNGVNRIFRL
jgi:hypothetical protein